MMANIWLCLVLFFGSQQAPFLEISPDQPELANNLKLRLQRMNMLGEAPRYKGNFESTFGETCILKNLSLKPDGRQWSLLWDKATPDTFEITLHKQDQSPGLTLFAIFSVGVKELKVTWSDLVSPIAIPQIAISNPSVPVSLVQGNNPFWAVLLLLGIGLGAALIIFLGAKQRMYKPDIKTNLLSWLGDPQQHNWKQLAPILEQLKSLSKGDLDLSEKIKGIEEMRFSGQDPDIQKIRELLKQHPSAFNE